MAKKVIFSVKVILIFTVLAIIFLPSIIKHQELWNKNRKLEERIEFLKRENSRLALEKARLETDITYVEKKARERLGVVRKGEIVLKNSQ